jgi:hypothetical protein
MMIYRRNPSFREWLVIIAVVAAWMCTRWLYGRWRSKAIFEAATALGFTPATDEVGDIPEMHLFDQGGSSSSDNVLKGCSAGYEALLFDYSYEINMGRSTRTVSQSVAAFHVPGANMPDFQIVPRTLAVDLTSLFSRSQVNLESNPDFAKKYSVRGADSERGGAVYPGGDELLRQ